MSIMIAYDGRFDTKAALEYATKLSVGLNEPLYIITIVSREQMDPDYIDPSIQKYMQEAQAEASSCGADVHTIIEVGKPEDTLVEAAENYQCSTIVVGRPARSRFDRMVTGSVSQHLVENCKCAVVIVPTPDDD